MIIIKEEEKNNSNSWNYVECSGDEMKRRMRKVVKQSDVEEQKALCWDAMCIMLNFAGNDLSFYASECDVKKTN